MKRKIVIVVVFLLLAFVISQKISYAVDILPIPQPGTSCGDPTATGDAQKCCKSTIVTPGGINFGSPIFDAAYLVIKPLIDNYSNPIVQKQKSINIKPCAMGVPSTPGDINNAKCICLIDMPKAPLSAFATMCERQLSSPSEQAEQKSCKECANTEAGVWTALGCFNGNLSEFITKNIMNTGIGIAGGISLLCIMLAAFQMQTSAGNAEKVKKAQELMTNCITGLMVIIFSVFILKIIGVDILKIPGFG